MRSVAANEWSGRGCLRQPALPAESEHSCVGAQQEHHTDAAAEVEEAGDLIGHGLDYECC